jgi:hypothetical protein
MNKLPGFLDANLFVMNAKARFKIKPKSVILLMPNNMNKGYGLALSLGWL